MGLFTIAFPALFLSGRLRDSSRPYDPEKASPPHSQHEHDSPDLDHDDSEDGHDDDHLHSSQDVLNNNTPHRRVRRVYSNIPKAALSGSTAIDGSSDDFPEAGPSLYSRVKSYVWPSNDQIEEANVPNYRWTPIISGIIIPFSILLEIPGLTVRWYIKTEANKTVDSKPNPVILDIGLAVSLACAVIANVGLILRFLEKRVQTVTLICITFLTVHDLINIIAVTIFGVEHRFDDGFTYGEAFWMTVCSTIASTVTNVSLIVDFVRTPDFAKRGSGLTRKQRSLMIIVIALLVYIAFGALINTFLLKLTFIDALYFTVVSIETIGFGDIHPQSTGAKIWTCFYVSGGVLNIGMAIAMCRESVMEGLEIGYRRRMREMRQRRREARRYRRWEARWQRAVEFRLREAGYPIWLPDSKMGRQDTMLSAVNGVLPDGSAKANLSLLSRVGSVFTRTRKVTNEDQVFGARRGYHLNVDALSTAQLEEAALEAGVPLKMFLDLGVRQENGGDGDGAGMGAHMMNGLPAGVEGQGVGPALAQTSVAHAFRSTLASGWPAHPHTPTHAQIGRMAAILTKFAVGVVGAHAHAPGLPHSAYLERQESARQDAADKEQEGGEAGKARAGGGGEIRHHPAAKWLREFARGGNQRSGWTYEKYMAEMEAEEKKAYYVKLIIAWSIFFLFWIIGSGIFSATEGWSYGTAMYFCFVAFSTLGYGDYSPQTPAGRSVFVVWALFGVGALTILVAVLQEAGSSRYKSALHSRVFDKAVSKYRKKQLQDSKQQPRPAIGKSGPAADGQPQPEKHQHSHRHPPSSHRSGSASALGQQPDADKLRESEDLALKTLETLPHEIVRMSNAFRDFMRFFVSEGSGGTNPLEERDVMDPAGQREQGGSREGDVGAGGRSAQGNLKVPGEMRALLEELAGLGGFSGRVKAEILQDEDARKTLFLLSLEHSLKRCVTSAEKALSALADRDALKSLVAASERRPSVRAAGHSTPSMTSIAYTSRKPVGNNEPSGREVPTKSAHPSEPAGSSLQDGLAHDTDRGIMIGDSSQSLSSLSTMAQRE